MNRILLQVEYDGTNYAGWQRQLNGIAVQQVLEETLSSVCGHPVKVTGSSRTDAGVHAHGQMVHFDTSARIPAERYPFALNNLLPRDIRVLSGRLVPNGFHARFLACGKKYTYRILNSRHGSALMRFDHYHVPVPLNDAAMTRAASTLSGEHDFAAFQASGGTAKTTIRTIHDVQLARRDDEIIITVAGNAFLYNMVRIIAGTLVEIGHGKKDEDAFLKAFETHDRLSLGMTAPACGLELTEVYYPAEAFIAPDRIRWHEDDAECCD